MFIGCVYLCKQVVKSFLLVSRMLRHILPAICSPVPIPNIQTLALKRKLELKWKRGCSADAAESRPASWQGLLQLSLSGWTFFLLPIEEEIYIYSSTGTGFLTTMTTMSRLVMDLVGPA